jgi:hypothetical protein
MTSHSDYIEFIAKKTHSRIEFGFDPIFIPSQLFDFQTYLLQWALRKGRSAIFADCGLGKTIIELAWADNVVRHTGQRVILLTPLAVTHQIKQEAIKFDFEADISRDGQLNSSIIITNYERLHLFSPDDFVGIICDESSILKSFSGATKSAITTFARHLPYRLLATATAAPNDFIELGTSSEAIGNLGYMDMLNRFFKNSLNNSASGRMRGEVIKWRLKGHAEVPFWQWVCTWAMAVRRPSDIGFSDDKFILPPLSEIDHVVKSNTLPDGYLFSVPAVGLKEQREERRRTISERCDLVSNLVAHDRPAIAWCHLNNEGDLLEHIIPDAVQVSGRDSDDEKEAKLTAFSQGQERVLITKPSIGAWGLNYQHCNHATFFPSHSYEQYYQAIRRCWRFGQKRPVQVDIVTTEGDVNVLKNLQRKSAQSDVMFSNLVRQMSLATVANQPTQRSQPILIPSWLS